MRLSGGQLVRLPGLWQPENATGHCSIRPIVDNVCDINFLSAVAWFRKIAVRHN
jgi:hypothetical protein